MQNDNRHNINHQRACEENRKHQKSNDKKHPPGFQPCFIKRLIVDASKLTPLERGEESGEEALNVSL